MPAIIIIMSIVQQNFTQLLFATQAPVLGKMLEQHGHFIRFQTREGNMGSYINLL